MNATPEKSETNSPDDVYLTAVLFESSLALLAFFLGWILGPDPRKAIPEFDPANLWPIVSGLLYGTLAAIPILILVEGIRRIPWAPIRELEKLSGDSVIKTLLQLRPTELIIISLCAGVGEEVLFRGWMLPWLAGDSPGNIELGVALVGSSVAFGLMHPITKLYVVLAALMGLYFGMLLLVSGNLLVPIAAHAAYDAVQLIWTGRQEDEEETAE